MRGTGAKLILLLLILILVDAFSTLSGGPDPLHFAVATTALGHLSIH
jgi:hypothetical protein